MKQDILLKGQNIFIRTVEKSDTQFLYDLRQKTNLTGTVHAIPSYESHVEWLEQYFERDNDYLFLALNKVDNSPQGTVSLVDIDLIKGKAESGRWLMLPQSKAGVEALLLLYIVGFEHLHLNQIFFRVMTRNAGVVRFHKFVGAKTTGMLESEVVNGNLEEMTGFVITLDNWPKVKKYMQQMANMFA